MTLGVCAWTLLLLLTSRRMRPEARASYLLLLSCAGVPAILLAWHFTHEPAALETLVRWTVCTLGTTIVYAAAFGVSQHHAIGDEHGQRADDRKELDVEPSA